MTRRSKEREETTLTSASEVALEGGGDEATRLVLVLVWSRDEPGRVGELFDPLAAPRGPTFTIGRTSEPDDDGTPALLLRQLRPFSAAETGALRAARVSRRQLRLSVGRGGAVEIERLAAAPLRVNGRLVDRATLSAGDLVEVERRFSLLASLRPAAWPSEPRLAGEVPFAGADRAGMVGESPAAWSLRREIAFVAGRSGHVFVRGPSGSGKELVVRAIHAGSGRGREALVARNASTIPDTLIDAELFGNLKNFPNPGMPERPGLLGQANHSTLFLDEIGELPQALQAHLLRVMDSGEYQRLGEAITRRTDARVVGATNRPLSSIKHDLLARFVYRIEVRGLGERVDDVPLLARHILRGIAAEDPEVRARFFAEGEPRISGELARALLRRPYATHARELAALLWRAVQTSSGDELTPPPEEQSAASEDRPSRAPTPATGPARAPTPTPTPAPTPTVDVGELTRDQVVDALARCGGVQERAWRALGLRSRYQLRRLLKKHGIAE